VKYVPLNTAIGAVNAAAVGNSHAATQHVRAAAVEGVVVPHDDLALVLDRIVLPGAVAREAVDRLRAALDADHRG
jgi:hypothetical protein